MIQTGDLEVLPWNPTDLDLNFRTTMHCLCTVGEYCLCENLGCPHAVSWGVKLAAQVSLWPEISDVEPEKTGLQGPHISGALLPAPETCPRLFPLPPSLPSPLH